MEYVHQYLSLPFHSCHRYAKQQDDGKGANYTDVIDLICDESIYTLPYRINQ